jgi:hypothetical protein
MIDGLDSLGEGRGRLVGASPLERARSGLGANGSGVRPRLSNARQRLPFRARLRHRSDLRRRLRVGAEVLTAGRCDVDSSDAKAVSAEEPLEVSAPEAVLADRGDDGTINAESRLPSMRRLTSGSRLLLQLRRIFGRHPAWRALAADGLAGRDPRGPDSSRAPFLARSPTQHSPLTSSQRKDAGAQFPLEPLHRRLRLGPTFPALPAGEVAREPRPGADFLSTAVPERIRLGLPSQRSPPARWRENRGRGADFLSTAVPERIRLALPFPALPAGEVARNRRWGPHFLSAAVADRIRFALHLRRRSKLGASDRTRSSVHGV